MTDIVTFSGKTLVGDMTVSAGMDDYRRRVSIRIKANPGDVELHFTATIAEELGKMLVAAAESTKKERLGWESALSRSRAVARHRD